MLRDELIPLFPAQIRPNVLHLTQIYQLGIRMVGAFALGEGFLNCVLVACYEPFGYSAVLAAI